MSVILNRSICSKLIVDAERGVSSFDDRHGGFGVLLQDVRAHPLERRLLALAAEVGDLGLERADEVGGRIDDLLAEPEHGVGRRVEHGREPGRIRVETDTQQGVRRCPRAPELVVKAHAADGRSRRPRGDGARVAIV